MPTSISSEKISNTIEKSAHHLAEQGTINQLDNLLSIADAPELQQTILKLFFENIDLHLENIETLPVDFRNTASNVFALYNFLDEVESQAGQ